MDATQIKDNIGNALETVPNLITNSLPTSSTSWQGSNATLSYVSAGGPTPANGYVKGVTTTASARVASPSYAATAGQIITGRAMAKAPADSHIRAALMFGSTPFFGTGIIQSTGEWTQLEITGVVPTTGTVRMAVYSVSDGWTVGDELGLAEAMLTEGSDLWQYFGDGTLDIA